MKTKYSFEPHAGRKIKIEATRTFETAELIYDLAPGEDGQGISSAGCYSCPTWIMSWPSLETARRFLDQMSVEDCNQMERLILEVAEKTGEVIACDLGEVNTVPRLPPAPGYDCSRRTQPGATAVVVRLPRKSPNARRFSGRDASCLAPPAQIRTCGFPAYGLYGAISVKRYSFSISCSYGRVLFAPGADRSSRTRRLATERKLEATRSEGSSAFSADHRAAYLYSVGPMGPEP